jgi:hypothetical protein
LERSTVGNHSKRQGNWAVSAGCSSTSSLANPSDECKKKKEALAASYGDGRGGIVFIRGGGLHAYITAANQFSVSVSGLCCVCRRETAAAVNGAGCLVRLKQMVVCCGSVWVEMVAFIVNGCTPLPQRC